MNPCKWCEEKPARRYSIYCEECRGRGGRLPARHATIGEYRLKYPKTHQLKVREFCRKWNPEIREMPCAFCGYEKHVELAHVEPIAAFPDGARLRDVNASSNVIPLCPNCHWEFDNAT